MAALFKRTGMAVTACLGVLGIAGIAGYAAGCLNAPPGSSASDIAEMSAAETVSLRFPSDWSEAEAPAPTRLAFASADASLTLFDPAPIYPSGTGKASPAAV